MHVDIVAGAVILNVVAVAYVECPVGILVVEVVPAWCTDEGIGMVMLLLQYFDLLYKFFHCVVLVHKALRLTLFHRLKLFLL
jgi:hypothetical protein